MTSTGLAEISRSVPNPLQVDTTTKLGSFDNGIISMEMEIFLAPTISVSVSISQIISYGLSFGDRQGERVMASSPTSDMNSLKRGARLHRHTIR